MEFSGRNEKFVLYAAVRQYLVDGLVDAALKKEVSRMAANFVIRESKLFYTGPSAQFMRLVVLSDEQRRAVLEECHNNPGTGNHGGVRATMDRVVVGYYWDNIKADVADWVKEPWEVVGMDLIGPLKKTMKDHQYVLTVTDLFTKWVIAEPLKCGSSTEVAEALVSKLYTFGHSHESEGSQNDAEDIGLVDHQYANKGPLWSKRLCPQQEQVNCQYMWTRLPQGLKDSPAVFAAVVQATLKDVKLPPETCLLQYADDILVTGASAEMCAAASTIVCNVLAEAGFKASKEKLQWVQRKVTYLGHELSQGQVRLSADRVTAIAAFKHPSTRKQMQSFLGLVNYCRLWVPNCSMYDKILREATLGDKEDITWTAEMDQAFRHLKSSLLRPPALGLPCYTREFHLYIHESGGTAAAILAQDHGEKPTHPFVPGQQVLVKCLKPTKLGEPNYLGPATVIAVTRTGVLTDLQPQWIHASRVKAAPSQGNA
ncbi:unnamed protein product [Leuciscus chuanchicus]